MGKTIQSVENRWGMVRLDKGNSPGMYPQKENDFWCHVACTYPQQDSIVSSTPLCTWEKIIKILP